jgi:dipeptidyl aminopeptidase/acylaminoacyl peptidase
VPITNAYALHHALKDNGVTVKFIAIPVAERYPYDFPVYESDMYRLWVDWMDQYLK